MNEDAQRVTFDESRWPIVIVKLPSHGPISGVHDWYDYVETLLVRSERPLGMVHDLRELEILSGTWRHRRAIADRTRKIREEGLHHKIAADARVLPNDVIANVVAVVDRLTGERPWPQANFTSMEHAIAWAARNVALAQGGLGASDE